MQDHHAKENRLSEYMTDSYGSPEELSLILNSCIEMLFYLEEGVFDRREVQNVVSVLKDVIILLKQQGW
ncbi:hypothetical protein LV716_14550 [Flagellimonas sp. HMM57]|uniref:hypothetical protein n=1 Tax=unclassified Flagellimonas TaxID=2644544 RepID=UPI0013D4AE9C|nr:MULTISPECIES: hypothetical protein [unclassified Flagellimonas]UII75468.1 hypothetical protein LV716_14550 [Flagellimonas sp. HMM57]